MVIRYSKCRARKRFPESRDPGREIFRRVRIPVSPQAPDQWHVTCYRFMPRSEGLLVAVVMATLLAGSHAATAKEAPPDGAQLFLHHCAPCHGADGRGDGPDADLFAERPRNLRDPALGRYDTAAMVRRIREGRALALPLDPAALRARLRELDALETHLRRLPTVDWKAARRGTAPYAAHCERCHGPFGETADRTLDLASPALQQRLDDATILAVVHRGHGGMPPLAEALTRDQERDLVTFVRVLSPGFLTYRRYCAPCHGDDGHPPETLSVGIRRPHVVFDAAYFSAVDRQVLETAIWHMLDEKKPHMPHFAPVLDESEVEAIVEYLRSEPERKPR